MATSAGTIAVNVVANTSGVSRNLKKARTSFQRFSKSVGSTLRLLGGFGTAGGIAGIAIGFRRAADEIDSLAKTSLKLGIATKKLAGLEHAAKMTGVSTQTLHMALQRLGRRVSEASRGAGEARDTLKLLGLNARELNDLPLDRQLLRVADAMSKVTNSGDRLAHMQKLVDSEGVELIKTISIGSRGLREMQKEAEALGLAVSEKAAAKVTEFNEAMTQLKATMGGVFRGIMIDIAPAATKAVNELQEIMAGVREMKGETSKKGLQGPIGGLYEALNLWRDANKFTYTQMQNLVNTNTQGMWEPLMPKGSSSVNIPRGGAKPSAFGARFDTWFIENVLGDTARFRKPNVPRWLQGQAQSDRVRIDQGPSFRAQLEALDELVPQDQRRRVSQLPMFLPKALFGSNVEIERNGKKWRQKNAGAIENVAKDFVGSLSVAVRETKFKAIAAGADWMEGIRSQAFIRDNLPELMERFGIDKIVEGARQARQRRPANVAIERNTMEGFRALRANLRGKPDDTKAILRKQLSAQLGANKLLNEVIKAVAKEEDVELVEIP
jgi:hypothetical protein